ncbi:hypothetical protein OM33_18640 [Pseudoalteromonas piratica]|uniref:Uncharacterized protein n=1 Tax=Pseudoalteromonas piratica TaxID=1348114 RepID=A0A0A7EM06_9GAMM|nr:hypothetical protein OM33_18640 [Pseudoalteromonas piratica]
MIIFILFIDIIMSMYLFAQNNLSVDNKKTDYINRIVCTIHGIKLLNIQFNITYIMGYQG